MSVSWDFIAKLVVIGDSGTGKSSLTIRLCENRFVQQHDVTIGVEFGTYVVPVNLPCRAPASHSAGSTTDTMSSTRVSPSKRQSRQQDQQQKYMKLSLWDTAGQETYKSITKSYFRGASGALLVFDISRRTTFDSATKWLNDLRQIAEHNIVIILVGNKSDIANAGTLQAADGESQQRNQLKRQVSVQEARQWCEVNGVLSYVETSAKNGEGVKEAFQGLANRIYENIEAGKYDLNDRRSGVKGAKPVGRSDIRKNYVELTATDNTSNTRCC